MKKEKISVVLCTYNGEKYLQEQLESIINQTYPIYELIIQDDISTDNTIKIIRKYQEKYNFIYLFINENRLGAHLNFLNVLKKVSGDYIAISDQDDVWELTKIEKQMLCLENSVLSFSLSKSFGDGVVVDSESRIPNVNIFRLLFYPVIPGHAMLFKRVCITNIPKKACIEYPIYDLLLAFSAILFGGITNCPEVLNYHRRHQNAFSYSKPKNYNKTFLNVFRYIFSGINGYFRKKQRIQSHFRTMYNLLILFNPPQNNEVRDALLFSKYMSNGSLCKASVICYRRRNEIFYSKSKDNFVLKFRALLFPLLCSDYY